MESSNCDRCYRRKSKCDRLRPCSSCRKAGNIECTYTDKTKERTVRPDAVDRLERRLSQAEGRNRALESELARIRSPTCATITEHVYAVTDRGPPHELHTPRAASENRNNGAVASEVSALSMNAAGDRQYLGSTSGVLFADLVRASIDAPVTRHGSPICESTTTNAGYSLDDISHQRPTKSVALKLIEAYLNHDFLAYPFLVPQHVYNALDVVYSETGPNHATVHQAFLVDMILAISTAHVSKHDWQRLPGSESHHVRAMSVVTEILRPGGLQALHAILLLCQYRTGSPIQDNTGSMWHLVGIAARMCFEMGLHKSSTFTLNAPADLSTVSTEYIAQESKRRSFWCVVAMDRITSNILGRPSAIRDEDFDHSCPEYDLTLSVSPQTHGSHVFPFVFKHIISYRLLCGKITKTMHGKRPRNMLEQEALHMRDDLNKELEKWHADTSTLNLDHGAQERARFESCYLRLDWYELLYSNALLMLWRPAPLLSGVSDEGAALQPIFESAKSAIKLYASLHKSGSINYSWITLQSVFMAGLSYIYAVSRHFRGQRQSSHDGVTRSAQLARSVTINEVINDTRACSNVLVAVSERWNTSRHCHEVFDRLSDAVLADAIKLYAAPQAPVQQNWISIRPQEVNNVRENQWPNSANHTTPSPALFNQSPLAVDSEFIECFGDIQNLFNLQQFDDPVMELSHDWMGYLDNSDVGMGGQNNYDSGFLAPM